MMPVSPQDPATQLNTFKTYVTLIADSTPGSKLQSFDTERSLVYSSTMGLVPLLSFSYLVNKRAI